MRSAYAAVITVLLLASLLLAITVGPNSGTGSGASWTTPANTATIDATYATCSILAGPDSLCAGNLSISSLGFSIPAGSIITGITLTMVRKCSAISSCSTQDSALTNYIFLTKVAGTPVGIAKGSATGWTTADVTDTWGGPSDLWGTTWSASDINSTGFGATINVVNADATFSRTASIDYLALTVDYTPPSGRKGQTIIASQARVGKVFNVR